MRITNAKRNSSEYVHILGYENIKFITTDNVLDFIFVMGNIMIPTTIAIGIKYA